MAGLALRDNDIGYARFLSGKVQAVAHTLEIGKYNEYSPMLDIVCAGKDVEGTYKVVKHLLDNVGTMYDFRKSGSGFFCIHRLTYLFCLFIMNNGDGICP